MKRFLLFSRDILFNGIGLWIVPWTVLVWLAFEAYQEIKRTTGLEDLGFGWPVIVIVLMIAFGHFVLGPRFERIFKVHFPDQI